MKVRVLLVVYDNGSYIHEFPIGLGHIAGALRRMGADVAVYSQDLHHYPDEHLTAYLDRNPFDMVGVSVIGGYYQYRKLLALAAAINRSRNRPFFVIGGHGPAPEPEYFLRKTQADVAVIGEGEETVVDLVGALSAKRPLDTVPGIAFRDGDRVVVNPRRPLIADVDSIPWPAYDLFPMEHYRLGRMPMLGGSDFLVSMLSGRGCTFKCNFCYRMDEGFRPRASEGIVEEALFLKKTYGARYISFVDELLMSSVERTEEICRAFIKAKSGLMWGCNGRLNYARPDLLRLMKEAGCVFVNYGIESMDDTVLRNMNKALTTRQVVRGVEATQAAGLTPGLNIIFGNLGDTRETLEAGVEFLVKYDDCTILRTIRPVTPYPGSPLYYHAMEQGLLRDVEDFYENKHLNSDLLAVNFTELSDDEFYEALVDANSRLVDNYFSKRRGRALEEVRRLYAERDATFRGFRQT